VAIRALRKSSPPSRRSNATTDYADHADFWGATAGEPQGPFLTEGNEGNEALQGWAKLNLCFLHLLAKAF
jgi:hypothetical protein